MENTFTLTLTETEAKNLLVLLDMAVGSAPAGTRLQASSAALPVAAKLHAALQPPAPGPSE